VLQVTADLTLRPTAECLILYSAKAVIVPHRVIQSWYNGRWWVACYIWYSNSWKWPTNGQPTNIIM